MKKDPDMKCGKKTWFEMGLVFFVKPSQRKTQEINSISVKKHDKRKMEYLSHQKMFIQRKRLFASGFPAFGKVSTTFNNYVLF